METRVEAETLVATTTSQAAPNHRLKMSLVANAVRFVDPKSTSLTSARRKRKPSVVTAARKNRILSICAIAKSSKSTLLDASPN